MANGDVHDQVSDQYLKQFDRSVGVSGMQKLQSFPELQKLGHAGTLSHQKQDFHGLQDFKTQMAKYSTVTRTLRIAWSLIQFVVPNNPSIQKKLITSPGLGTVGEDFKSIHGFGQVFSLTPGDLKSPAAVQSKAAVYKTQSTHASVTTNYSSQNAIGGGASPSVSGNASMLNGFLIVGTPTAINNSLGYDNATGNLVWGPGGGGGGGGSSTLAGLTDILLTSLASGNYLKYNGTKWINHSLVAGDIPNIAESQVTGLVTDLSTLTSAIASEASTRATADALLQLLSEKDAANGYAGLTAGGLLKAAEFPTPTTSTFGGVKDIAAVSHEFVTSIVNGVPVLGQPTFTDLSSHPTTISGYGITDALSSGTVLPATKTVVSHQFFTSYDSTTGLFTSAQPAASDITGLATVATSGAYSDLSGTPTLAQTKAAVTSNWLRSYDATTGLFTASQPVYSDISGTPQLAQTKALVTHQFFTSYTASTGLFTAAQVDYADLTGTPPGSSAPVGSTVSTSSLSYTAGERKTFNLTMAKSFLSWLVTEATSKKFRLQLYATSAARTADAARNRTTPLALGSQHGCILDMYFDQSVATTPFTLSPPIIGSNNDGTQATTIYAAITSFETTTQTIAVTINYVALES